MKIKINKYNFIISDVLEDYRLLAVNNHIRKIFNCS